MKRWLWPVNIGLAAALLACTALPVVTYDSRMAKCGPTCDVHGYVFVFSIMVMLPLALLALTVLTLMLRRRRAGLVVGLLSAFLVGVFAAGLSASGAPWLLVLIGVLALGSLGSCVAGLVLLPRRERTAD